MTEQTTPRCFTSTQLQNKGGAVLAAAAIAPVVITRHGDRFVLMTEADLRKLLHVRGLGLFISTGR